VFCDLWRNALSPASACTPWSVRIWMWKLNQHRFLSQRRSCLHQIVQQSVERLRGQDQLHASFSPWWTPGSQTAWIASFSFPCWFQPLCLEHLLERISGSFHTGA
jgi:hypothetical protein